MVPGFASLATFSPGHCTVTVPLFEIWAWLSASAERGVGRVLQSSKSVGAETVTLKLAPDARLAISQCKVPAVIVHSVLSGSSLHVKPAGSTSSMSTLVAVPGPPLLTVMVKLIGLPALTTPPSGVLLMVRFGHCTVTVPLFEIWAWLSASAVAVLV